MLNYDFPVKLEPVYDQVGEPIKHARAVVNQDNRDHIAVVSDKYTLVPHKLVVEMANIWAEQFGILEPRVFLSKNGGVCIAQYTYKDIRGKVVGDEVGLRLYVGNSYNRTRGVHASIGALVLTCMNGSVAQHIADQIYFRHVGADLEETVKKSFPSHEQVMGAFDATVESWEQLAGISYTAEEYQKLATEAVEEGVVKSDALIGIESDLADEKTSAWNLYNRFTYDITHNTTRGSYIGQLDRLARVDKWVKRHAS